jgi:diphthamide biosynthesis protein 4
MSSGSALHAPSYYEILQLPPPRSSQTLTKEDIKAAYHRALLVHHPDKATKNVSTKSIAQQSTNAIFYSIDQIVAAYETLADPLKRSAYNKQFEGISNGEGVSRPSEEKGTHPGVEALDLEDLSFDEENSTWHHQCRCGNEDGYVVTEAELDSEAEHGEIYVGCRGCSLFIKVMFRVTEAVTLTDN